MFIKKKEELLLGKVVSHGVIENKEVLEYRQTIPQIKKICSQTRNH